MWRDYVRTSGMKAHHAEELKNLCAAVMSNHQTFSLMCHSVTALNTFILNKLKYLIPKGGPMTLPVRIGMLAPEYFPRVHRD